MKNMLKSLIWGGGVISLIAMSSLPVVAQTLPSLPDVFVSNVTTTDNGVPDPKLDDVVVNCDMLRNAKTGNPMKAIAWDEGNCNKGEALDIAQLPIGNYLLQITNGDSYQFTKQ